MYPGICCVLQLVENCFQPIKGFILIDMGIINIICFVSMHHKLGPCFCVCYSVKKGLGKKMALLNRAPTFCKTGIFANFYPYFFHQAEQGQCFSLPDCTHLSEGFSPCLLHWIQSSSPKCVTGDRCFCVLEGP